MARGVAPQPADAQALQSLTRSYVDRLTRRTPDERERLRTSIQRAAAAPPPQPDAPRPAASPVMEPSSSRIAAPTEAVQSSAAGWTAQAAAKPSGPELRALRDRVKKDPLDRAGRNALAFALNRKRENQELLDLAFAWQPSDPDNPMVYEYLGDAYTRMRERTPALRAYSSIAEVSPGDSGLLNRAGFLALKAGEPAMAETLFRFAIERRPDHANNYRGLALALWTQSRFEDAVKALTDALARNYNNRYGDLPRVLREELGYVLSAWSASDAKDAARAKDLAAQNGVDLARTDALRITLHWETDANDVDLHVVDPDNEECYYSHRNTRSGLNLYEDLTQGLGPECATVPPGKLAKGVYHVGVNYFAAGPMGVSRGVVVIQRPSVKGKPELQIETFCLLPDLEGGKDLRHVAVIETTGN